MNEKLDKVSEKIKESPKLSTEEKKNFTEVFQILKEWLDDTLAAIIEKDRDEAYRYLGLLSAGLKKVDLDYVAGVAPPSTKKEVKPAAAATAAEENQVRAPKPDLMELINQLPAKEQGIAKRLDCYANYTDLGSNEATCDDCSLEKLIECIRIIDPSIDPVEDIIKEVEAARKLGEIV